MRFHRFFIETPIQSNEFDVSSRELVHQWKKVFRYNVGSQVIVFDGSGMEHLCMITRLGTAGATLSIEKTRRLPPQTRNLWLCLSLIKKDSFEIALQKATELGVSRIIPILSEHSEKKKINNERMRKIAIEASEQSGRGDVPVIGELTTLHDLFGGGIIPQEKVAFHPSGIPFSQYKASFNTPSLAAFIGPEGGYSDAEIALFKSYNIPIVSLGNQVLRAETAAAAVSALFLLS